MAAYPNPFNPSTKIVYTIPAHGEVWVDIHNVQGKVDQRPAGVEEDRPCEVSAQRRRALGYYYNEGIGSTQN